MAKNNVITKKCSMLPNLVIGSVKTHETDSAKFIFESTAVFNDPYEMNFQMGCSSSAAYTLKYSYAKKASNGLA